jgi:hypothetical protein
MNNMNNDDLYLTNRYKPISSSYNKNDSIEYKRLLDAKSRSQHTYKPNNPQFTEQKNIDRRSGIDLSEDSPGFDQYLKLSSINKNKKVKKTIVNVDSRNRQQISYYKSTPLVLRKYNTFKNYNNNRPFYFIGNSSTVYLLLETNYTNSIDNRQIIINKAPIKLFDEVNLNNELFVYNTLYSQPVFSNLEFFYDPLIDQSFSNRLSNMNNLQKITTPIPNDGRYRFNVIKFTMLSSIYPSIVYNNCIGDNSTIEVSLYDNCIQPYPNTSHFIINLGKTFSNIYSIRLLSTEIPNASYTFNGNSIDSYIGKLKLSTVVNNKLRWIVKENSITQLNCHLIEATFYNRYNNTSLIKNDGNISSNQLQHFNSYKDLYDISSNNPTLITNDTAYKYRNSLQRETTSYSLDNNLNIVYKDQYSINFIGNLDSSGINQPSNYIDNTLFMTNDLIHTYYSDLFESFYLYSGKFYNEDISGCLTDLSGITTVDMSYNTVFLFNRSNNTITISINISNNDYDIDWVKRDIINKYENETRTCNNYPIRIQFHSLKNINPVEQSTYIYDIVNIGSEIKYLYDDISGNYDRYRINYILNVIPIYSDLNFNPYLLPITFPPINDIRYDTSFNSGYYFNQYEDIIMTLWNPINDQTLSSIQSNNPYLYRLFKNYYLQTTTHLYTSDVESTYNQIVCDDKWLKPYEDYSGYLTSFMFDFKDWRVNKYQYLQGSSSTPTIGKFSIDNTNKLLYINYIDYDNYTNDDLLSNLSTYNYILVYPFYFKIDSSGCNLNINDQVIEISYTNTNYYINPNLVDLSNQFIDGSIYTFKFQEYDLHNIQNLYLMDIINNPIPKSQYGIIRICNIDNTYDLQHTYEYLDLFLGNVEYYDTSNNEILTSLDGVSNNEYYHLLEIRYKDENNFFTQNVQYNYNITFYLLEESHKSYLRNSISNYMSIKTRNYSIQNNNYINLYDGYQKNNDTTLTSTDYGLIYNVAVNSIPYMYDQLKFFINSKTEFANLADTVKYRTIVCDDITYKEGIVNNTFGKEYIEVDKLDSIVVYPSINSSSNQIFLPYLINNHSLNNYIRFPVYEYEIPSGKYNENLLKQYVSTSFNNIIKKSYNYKDEQFINDINYNEIINLYNETGLETKYKMTVNIDRNNNSLKYKYYRKIFNSNPSLFNINRTYISYNQGFPYLYFNIPDINIPNGSFVFIDGILNLDNIPSTDINKEHQTIVTKNFRVQARQLLPLPNIDYLNTKQNLYANDGYVSNAINELYNEYVNYINASLNDKSRVDIGFEFIMDRLYGVSEGDYSRNMNNTKLEKQQGYIRNDYQFYKGDLNKSYNNNYGNNDKYKIVNGFDNRQYVIQSKNKLGLEYIGSALVNSANNDKLWNEYNSDTVINKGFQTTFIKNECFVRLSDLYQNTHTTLLGRITYTTDYADEYGNITVDYDLFTDNNSQFNLCDIIIGLESQTIAVLLPYDYKYAELPTNEVKLLGLGAYILHTQYNINNFFYDRFKSIDNLFKNNELLSKYFIKEFNLWVIEENKTSKGFYIKLNTIPNVSRLSDVQTSNLRIYIPEFFKFLEGNDTPLDLFGFKDPLYNSQFNYFKDNYSPYTTGLINKSYVINLEEKDILIIFQMKEKIDARLNDTIFSENHMIINTSINSYRDNYMNVNLLEPFSKYITKLETIYNTEIQNYNGYNTVVSYNNNEYYFWDTICSLDISSTLVPIPFKNRYIANNFNEDKKNSSINYSLYYKYSVSSKNTSYTYDIFDIEYNLTDGLKLKMGGPLNINMVDILDTYRNLDINMEVKILPINDIINGTYFQSYYKSYNSNKFIKSSYSNLNLTAYQQYYINIHIVRKPITFKSRDISNNIISEYDTLGIFERIMTEWMNNMLVIYRNDLNKANYYNSKYNPNIFNNRIIKLKVSPIDNKGFSYEPINPIASSTNGYTREVKGYYRKLFPYCEYNIYNSYLESSNGSQILPNASTYRNYLRPMQKHTNNDEDAKIFLKGMGVYVINETIDSLNDSYFPATAYSYKNKFIGYVLDTSIDYDNNTWFRDYMLDSDTFSRYDPSNSITSVDLSNSRTSEYYIYMLLDEDIQTRQDIEELYDILDNDYTHIIFDANARDNEVIAIDGIINRLEYPYGYEWTYDKENDILSIGTLKNSSLDITANVAYIVGQNIYGNTSYLDQFGGVNIVYQEDKYVYNTNIISSSNVDGLLGLTASNIIINRKKANKTLPFYEYQTRIACATIIEKPVLMADNISNTKLFITGEYDYFYKNYMENKTIMHYDPTYCKENVEYLNKHQFIDEYPSNANFKSKNYKELDCHNGYIDSFYQKSLEYARGITYSNTEKNSIIETMPQRTLDIGDDVVFINSLKRKVDYNSGPNYGTLDIDNNSNTTLQNSQLLSKYGLESFNIKVLLGSLLPKIYLNDSRYLNSSWNNMFINTCVLDIDYYKNNLENFNRTQCLAKSRGYDLDIIGYKSDSYDKNSNLDQYQYNYFDLISYDDNSGSLLIVDPINIYKLNNTESITIDLNDPHIYPKLINSMIITYPILNTNVGQVPSNSIDFSEIGIIDDISYNGYGQNIIFNLENKLNNTYYINNKVPPYNEPNISIPYKVYDTIKTSLLNEFDNTCISNKFNLVNKSIICFKIPNDIYLINNISKPIYNGINNNPDISNNPYFYISYFHNEMIYDDTLDIIIDYAKERNIYGISNNKYIEDDVNGTKKTTTMFSRINNGYSNKKYNPFIYDYGINKYIYYDNSSIPILTNINYGKYLIDNIDTYNGVYTVTNNNLYNYYPMDGLDKSYYDICNNKLAISYNYRNDEDSLLNNTLFDISGNVTIYSPKETYKYADIYIDASYNVIDFVHDISYAISGSSINDYLLVQGKGYYKWNGTSWILINNSINYEKTYTIISKKNSISYYNYNRYRFDISGNYRLIPIYEHEIYRNELYYDFFPYDKIDFQITNIDDFNNNEDTIFPNYPYGMKFIDLCNNKLYINQSDFSGNHFIEYTIPDKTMLYVYQDLSTNGINKQWTTINTIKLYLDECHKFYDISGYTYSVNDIYKGPTLSLPSNKYRVELSNNIFDWSETIIVDDNNLYDVSGIYDTSGLLVKHNYTDDSDTFRINSEKSLEYKLVYAVNNYESTSYTNIFSKLYPLYTDYTVFDILTDEQRNQLLIDYYNNSTLLDDILKDGAYIIDYSGQYYKFNSGTISFNVLYGLTVNEGDNIYIYGNFSGHEGMLFKYDGSKMVYSQYYSDINVIDYYYSYGIDNSMNDIGGSVINKDYVDMLKLKVYDRILVHFGDTNLSGSMENYLYIMKPINNNINVLVKIEDDSEYNSIFSNNDNTIFVSSPKSYYRGQTFYRTDYSKLERMQISYSDYMLPIYYPDDTRLIALADPLKDGTTSKLSEYNGVATQPFLSGNEWYTKIYYRGSLEFVGRHSDLEGKVKGIFNNIDMDNYIGGNNKYNKFESTKLFISGMKGIRIPYTDITLSNISDISNQSYNNTRYMEPIIGKYCITTNPLIEDYMPYLITDMNNRSVYGKFLVNNRNYISNSSSRGIYYNTINNRNYINTSYNSNNNYYDTTSKFYDDNSSYNYPYVIVKGLYFGYGGHMQERFEEDIVNTIINNDIGFKVERVTEINNIQYIYSKLPIVYSQYFNQNQYNLFNKISSKSRNSLNNMPLDLQFNYLDKILEEELTDIYEFFTLYGKDGRIVRKSITTPYNLNPDNYVYLVIPNLDNIDALQNDNIKENAFAKILLPGDSNRILYNTYVSSSKVYYDYLYNNLSELEIAFVTNGGNLFDFNGSDLSFTLEITEIIDKLDFINPKFGNIEF